MPMLTQQMEMHAVSVGLLSVGTCSHTHTEDCLSMSMHKRNRGIQVVSVCTLCWRQALLVHFSDGIVNMNKWGVVSVSLRVMSSKKMMNLLM